MPLSRLGQQICEAVTALHVAGPPARRAHPDLEDIRALLRDRRGPFRALDDLMAAVEMLCKRWPERPVDRARGHRMLL